MKLANINIDVDTLDIDLENWDSTAPNAELRNLSFRKFLPRVLDLFDEFEIKATFFIIGRDGLEKNNRKLIKRIGELGHEIANHSLSHKKQLANLPIEEIKYEISESEKILSDIVGQRIIGFRAPGYTLSRNLLFSLEELGYRYDASMNSSLFYFLLKYFYKKFIVKNEDFLNLQDFMNLRVKRVPYFISSENMLEKENKQSGLLEFPIPVVPFISYPFVSSLLVLLGKAPVYLFFKLLKKENFFQFEIHDFEFATEDDIVKLKRDFSSMGRYVTKNIQNRLDYFRFSLSLFKRYYSFKTLKQIDEIIREKCGLPL